jgi:CRP/FNR family transcriptional regulator, cyclic AMP receptor protein
VTTADRHVPKGPLALVARAGDRHDVAMETSSLASQLARTWFAADLPVDVCLRMADIGEIRDYSAGVTVLQEGVPCEALGVVLSGRIALRLAVPGVGDRTIITIDDGDLFGWSALLPESAATSTGVTIAPTRAMVFERERLTAALALDCEVAAAIYSRVLVAVARRLAATRLQLLDVYRAGQEPW